MIVLFPFISFLRSDQSLIFSIVDAGRLVGGVDAVREENIIKNFFSENTFPSDDKNTKIKTIIGAQKAFFSFSFCLVVANKINALN